MFVVFENERSDRQRVRCREMIVERYKTERAERETRDETRDRRDVNTAGRVGSSMTSQC